MIKRSYLCVFVSFFYFESKYNRAIFIPDSHNIDFVQKWDHLPVAVVVKFVVTCHCYQTTKRRSKGIEYLSSCIGPNLQILN